MQCSLSQRRFVLAIWIVLLAPLAAPAQQTEPAEPELPSGFPFSTDVLPNIEAPTLGGLQYWGDQLIFRGWRVQRHVLTGHCRLLDEDNVRHAAGSFEHCAAELAKIRRRDKLPPVEGKVVIALHGLIRSRFAMSSLARHLEEKGDYTALTFG